MSRILDFLCYLDDTELLKLAAKAAGLHIDTSTTNGGGIGNTGFDLSGDAVLDWHNNVVWNPLKSNADAFVLAVKLKLSIEHQEKAVIVMSEKGKCIEPVTKYFSRESATRWAITIVAAEIGKTIP
jgi:hypothetical protein